MQETSFGAGMLAGVPAGIVDNVQGLVQLGLNPAQTLDALKGLINSGEFLGNATEAVKQSYLARIEAAEAQYQKAGASGSFNAGVEYGKLLAEGASLVAGGGGRSKGVALLTEKHTAKLVKEGVGETLTAGSKVIPNAILTRNELISGLPAGTEITLESVADIRKLPNGLTVWLETGSDVAGLQHIYKRHEVDFATKGILRDDIPSVVMNALERGNIVGTNGSANVNRITHNGVEQNIAIGVGSNGFVVRANSVSSWKQLP